MTFIKLLKTHMVEIFFDIFANDLRGEDIIRIIKNFLVITKKYL